MQLFVKHCYISSKLNVCCYLKKMENVETFIFICLCSWSLAGVFGVNEVKSVSVMEGDSVTLNTDGTDIQKYDQIMWKFGHILIAQINRKNNMSNVYEAGERFRGRLKLDHQTGSLSITNTRTTDSGVYNITIIRSETPLNIFNLTVYAHLPVPVISRDSASSSSSSSSPSGSSVSKCVLLCSVVNVSHVTLSWYKGNSLLSSINMSDLSISLSLPLEVEYQEKNTYRCELKHPISNQTTHLNISQLCQTYPEHSLTILYTVLISAAGFLLIVAAVMIFCTCRKPKKVNQEDTTCTEDIIYSETTFCKRNAHKSRDKVDPEVVYAGITVRC